MEAPEKLYIDSDDIEYIRKDIVDDMLKTAEDHAYFAGSEYMREEMMAKACEWLESVNLDWYQISEGVFSIDLVKDFRKAIEE